MHIMEITIEVPGFSPGLEDEVRGQKSPAGRNQSWGTPSQEASSITSS